MDFTFDFLIEMMASFYDFFMGIAQFLTYSIGEITISFALNNDSFTWSWFNPFSNSMSSSTLSNNLLLEPLRLLFDGLGLYQVPLWQAFLISMVSLFFISLVARVIGSLVEVLT